MERFIQLVGPHQALQIFGIRLVGLNSENARKLLLSVVFFSAIWLLSQILRLASGALVRDRAGKRIQFWTRQGIQLATAFLQTVGVLSIWFDDPVRLTTFLGLLSAGIAFALQKVITALAGYFVLLRGKTFNVGERIKMGGVRGDVMNPVYNYSRDFPSIWEELRVGGSYNADKARAEQILIEAAHRHTKRTTDVS